MKMKYTLKPGSLLLLFIILFACKKSIVPAETAGSLVTNYPLPAQLNYQCLNSPDYGDTILYVQPTKNDYIVAPVNGAFLGNGKFFAWPAGLAIDSLTGALNLSQSETGMRYVIGFVKTGSKDTCMKNLIVAGVTYADSLYVLSENDSLAIPYYNANAANPAVCNASNDSDYPDSSGTTNGDGQCIFDGKGKNGKTEQANSKKVRVRTISGIINLKKTLADGAFGSNPADGSGILVPIAYSLADNSKKALQQINVQLLYYRYSSSIPAAVLATIHQNRQAFFQNMPVSGSPRPPIIIVSSFK